MNQKCISICNPIDLILDGGIQIGEVTEIFGESGVGKNQTCLQLLLTCLLELKDEELYGSSIYIQACPVFPAERLNQVSLHILRNKLAGENPLSLVHVKKIEVADQIFLVLNQVELMVLNSLEGCRYTRVIVLDSIAYLFRHEHDNTCKRFSERNRMLLVVGKKMKDIAKTYNIAFVVVNEVTDVFTPNVSGTFTSGREIKPALGPKWETIISNRMFISYQYNLSDASWYREWMVVKSSKSTIQGRRCAFRITSNGLTSL
ncbi:DNA repair protein XRCC3 homolog [Chenopodium quinoa]|uniref:DNA repair protein XRCC3 homolog n=1 Tax=Chenopodium quinoa TaxID=63459 RepID=UPI000B773401|nr:DNA repair protein XRCC3 homolog [Chenopodium quinoa]